MRYQHAIYVGATAAWGGIRAFVSCRGRRNGAVCPEVQSTFCIQRRCAVCWYVLAATPMQPHEQDEWITVTEPRKSGVGVFTSRTTFVVPCFAYESCLAGFGTGALEVSTTVCMRSVTRTCHDSPEIALCLAQPMNCFWLVRR